MSTPISTRIIQRVGLKRNGRRCLLGACWPPAWLVGLHVWRGLKPHSDDNISFSGGAVVNCIQVMERLLVAGGLTGSDCFPDPIPAPRPEGNKMGCITYIFIVTLPWAP